MTETEWLSGNDLFAMIAFTRDRTTVRRSRLFACASARLLWDHYFDDRSRHCVNVAERFADGRADLQECVNARAAGNEAHREAPWYAMRPARVALGTLLFNFPGMMVRFIDDVKYVLSSRAARDAAGKGHRRYVHDAKQRALEATLTRLCDLYREIHGNPFHPVVVDPLWLIRNDAAVHRLVTSIHEASAWEDLPILADALEDAGCEDEELLAHCREPHEHVPGCWVLDALLEENLSVDHQEK